jgi:hypothetical protein
VNRYTHSGIAAALVLGSGLAMAQSAHVHGEGRLNIAIEGNRLFMQLESPGADIVGFEHEARSSDEKAALARSLKILEDPAKLMRFTADAKCEVRQAHAEIEGEHDAHEQDGHGHEEHDDHAHKDHGKEGHGDEHGAFVAEYDFECSDIDELETIEFSYFDQFDNAQKLDVILIDGSGQRQIDIDRNDPLLRLAQ